MLLTQIGMEPKLQTSEILIQDIKDNLLTLAREPEASSAVSWLHRSNRLLLNLLPIVIYLEQTGVDVEPASFANLNALEQWLTGTEKSLEFQRSATLLSGLKDVLQYLPGYKQELIGNQSPMTEEKYQYQLMIAKNLYKASRFQVEIISPQA